MKIAVLGIVGVPGRYGGFETLAENLVHYHTEHTSSATMTVWCSAVGIRSRPASFRSAALRYVPLKANGIQSVLFDGVCIFQAILSGHNRIVLLGVSGALILPLVRLFSRVKVVTNIDGIEWRRQKWSALTRLFLRVSEWAAVRFSHVVIADNQAIADYVDEKYKRKPNVIAYGGDHALEPGVGSWSAPPLPISFALTLCRIEPENNIHTILEAWTRLDRPLVLVGNWDSSSYGRELKARFAGAANIYLLNPVYEPRALYTLRSRASLYVHGHSCGGTNPSLVEMMHFGVPVVAHGCTFNRYTTNDQARYFGTSDDLVRVIESLSEAECAAIGASMRRIATANYRWENIGRAYFELLFSS